ncbi:hypothetical protein SAMN04487906_2153 [Zhouia amylolytica]|uniref:PH domain-containing protein n=1 Tax=Zhouia amylolytica TaxID=376730 RepID=A0A1I6TUG0_9FLAO|nr:hypothetical protein [Zhouia amylolytica]MCQ0112565.1 hypothetical protein [Zhouia amylolytica]SFS92801.1 hypothetical protein SAMN04487906_2153 [Zhouia amylolytica]
MNSSQIFNRNLLNFGIPLILLGSLILLMTSSSIIINDTLGMAISADLLLTIPAIYYLLIRNTKVSKLTVIPFIVFGLLAGSYFLPIEKQTYLILFKTWALPVIELSVFSLIIIKISRAIKKFKALKGDSPDFYDVLRRTCYDVLPGRLVLPFATEVAVLYYSFICWKRRPLKENEFSYHLKSGSPALMGALIFIILIEAVAMHFLIVLWSHIAAWILTGLSIYTAIQFLGFVKSLSQRPISLDGRHMSLRYGIMNETRIPYSCIKSIHIFTKDLKKDTLTRTLSPLGALESHNIIIYLKDVHTLNGLYGIKKEYKVIGFHIDEPQEFVVQVQHLIHSDVK